MDMDMEIKLHLEKYFAFVETVQNLTKNTW